MSDRITAEEVTTATQYARPITPSDLSTFLLADAEDALRAAAAGRPRGPVSKLPELDRAIGRFFRSGIYGFTGDPGAGKTCITLQIAADCGFPAVYVTAEQAPHVLYQKHIARVTETPLSEVENAVPNTLRGLLEKAAPAASRLLFLDATSNPAPAAFIEGFAREMQRRHEAAGVLVVVDALQPWARGVYTGVEYEALQAGLKDLVGMARRLNAPVLLLSHRNRASAGSENTMIAAKGTADFEHLAEAVLHLSAIKGSEEPLFPGRRKVKVGISKNRWGSDEAIELTFDRRFQVFRP